MKILFISENYYPNLSGVPIVVQYLAEQLVKDHDVAVLTKKVNGCKNVDEYNRVKIFRKDVYMTMFKFYGGDKVEFVDFVKNYHADVYVLEGATVVTTDILLPHLRELSGIKILHSHGFSRLILKPFARLSTIKNTIGNTYNYFRWKGYFRNFLPSYINDFDGVMCLSPVDSSYDYLNKIYNKKVEILGNAVDDVFFEKSCPTLNKYTNIIGKGYFLSVANYDAVKNQIGILKEYYKCNFKNYDLVFIGREKNYYYEALVNENKKLSQMYEKRNVHILTNVDRADIPGIYEDAYLYLVGSEAEGYSLSIIESMSKGVPFISTDVGNAKLLPGGLIINDINKLSETINKLMKNKELYIELSKKGKKYACQECKIENATEKLLKIIKESRN